MSADAVRSRDEIASAIRAFTLAQWARLKRVAARYAPIGKMSAEDLLQEAFLRALNEDGRKCPVGIDVVKFLAEAMRSIANGEGEKIRAVAVLVPIGTHDNGDDQAYQVADGTPSTEDRLVSNEETVQRRQDLLAIFEDDEAARDIVDGTIEGMSTDEMRELTGLGKTAYDSKRKLIRRRIDKRYPDGWKP